jgi:hypothetical protein
MSFLHPSMQRSATMIIVALALLMAQTACATPTPTPTPTPAPVHVHDSIMSLSESSTFRILVELLPKESVNCLVGELGRFTYDQFLDLTIFGEDIDFGSDLPVTCFDQDTLISLLIANLSQAADGLTGTTVTCISETFRGLNVASLAAIITSGDIFGGAVNDTLGIGLGLLLCLNDDEASRISAGGIFGGIGSANDISLGDVKCILQMVDLRQLTGLIESLNSATELDFSTLPTLLTAVTGCGIDIGDLLGSDPRLPPSGIVGTAGNIIGTDFRGG